MSGHTPWKDIKHKGKEVASPMPDQERSISEEEHLKYHLEVSLTGCGVPGCDASQGLALHFEAEAQCAPSSTKCDCVCHRSEGVKHVVACCDGLQ